MKKTTPHNTASTKDKQQPVDNKKANTSDLADSSQDEEKLQGDKATLDLPEVKDIPGQEHIHVPRMRQFVDTTISSDDEEGVGLLDNLNDPVDEDFKIDAASNVSAEEAALLQEAAEVSPADLEEQRLRQTALDSTDDEGDLLNEKGFAGAFSGSDLDVPGSEEDDADEEIGEEDEENNPYSVDEDNEDDEKQ